MNINTKLLRIHFAFRDAEEDHFYLILDAHHDTEYIIEELLVGVCDELEPEYEKSCDRHDGVFVPEEEDRLFATAESMLLERIHDVGVKAIRIDDDDVLNNIAIGWC